MKSYEYFNFTNADLGNGANTNTTAGLEKVTKAAGVPDPVKISDIARGYVATTNLPTVTAAGFTQGSALLTGIGGGKFVVAPGGFAQNNSTYANVADYLIAEYGSCRQQSAMFTSKKLPKLLCVAWLPIQPTKMVWLTAMPSPLAMTRS